MYIYTTALGGGYHNYLHLINKKTKSHKSQVTLPKDLRGGVRDLGPDIISTPPPNFMLKLDPRCQSSWTWGSQEVLQMDSRCHCRRSLAFLRVGCYKKRDQPFQFLLAGLLLPFTLAMELTGHRGPLHVWALCPRTFRPPES